MKTLSTLPSPAQSPISSLYDNLPRALPVLAVAVDAAQIDHFEDERWTYQFDASSDVLHCRTLSDAEQAFVRKSDEACTASAWAQARSPDGEILYRLSKDLELEIIDLAQGKTWKSKLPELRVHPEAKIRLTMSKTGDQLFIHASGAHYLDRSQVQPTLFVFDTNRTPLRKPVPVLISSSGGKVEKQKKKKLVEKLFDKLIEKII